MFNRRRSGWIGRSNYNYKTLRAIRPHIKKALGSPQSAPLGVQQIRFIYQGNEYLLIQTKEENYFQVDFSINGIQEPIRKLRYLLSDIACFCTFIAALFIIGVMQ